MPVYSHSKLETFENCPQKYKFKYIDKIEKPGFQGVEAFVGNRVHEVLKKLYDDLLFEKRNEVADLLRYYRERWDKEWGPEVAIVEAGRTQEDYFEYGAACIRNYYTGHHPFGHSRTLATEERVQFPLDEGGEFQIQGYVDRIGRREDGTYEIHDYKTSRSVPSQHQADASRQLALYDVGLRRRWKDVQRVELIWHYVRHGVTLRSQRSEEQLTQLRGTTIELIQQIESEKKFEPHKSRLCDWCEYKPDCPLWKHSFKVASLPRDDFRADDGVRLADEYQSVRSRIKLLEHELEELKERIVAFAKRQGTAVLQGSHGQVSVRFTERVDFPRQGDPDREELEDILHRAGKWAEVSILSLPRLAKVFMERIWPAELTKKVGEFALRHEIPVVRIRRFDGSEEEE